MLLLPGSKLPFLIAVTSRLLFWVEFLVVYDAVGDNHWQKSFILGSADPCLKGRQAGMKSVTGIIEKSNSS